MFCQNLGEVEFLFLFVDLGIKLATAPIDCDDLVRLWLGMRVAWRIGPYCIGYIVNRTHIM